jgi:hypothetical protein
MSEPICDDGYQLNNDKCEFYTISDPTYCEKIDNKELIYDPNNKKCNFYNNEQNTEVINCIPDFKNLLDLNFCKCPPDFEKVDNKCLKYNVKSLAITQDPKCQPYEIRLADNKCKFIRLINGPKCQTGYKLENNKCHKVIDYNNILIYILSVIVFLLVIFYVIKLYNDNKKYK